MFKMLDEDRDGVLNIVDLLRLYVNLPKTSAFAAELRVIYHYYLDNSLKPAYNFQRKIDYNFNRYHVIVPISCLAVELKERFIDRVKQ